MSEGVKYTWTVREAVTRGATPEADAALAEALTAHPGPAHVHCIMNWRVTAFFYLLDCAAGVPEPEARARMAKVWNPLEDESAPEVWRALVRGEG